MRNKIKRAFCASKVGHRLLCEYMFIKQKRVIRVQEKKANSLGLSFYEIGDLGSNKLDNHLSCHIIGSGWSLHDSLHLARDESAYVIGNNFACLSGIEFDTYFVEFGGQKCSSIAKKQKACLDYFEDSIKGWLLFKNIWEDKNDIEYAVKLYQEKITFIRDVVVPCFDERYLDQSAKMFLEPDWAFLRQYKSTVLTAINLARYLGFRDIVLHGVDFGGGYFFDLPEYSHLKDLLPPQDNSVAYSGDNRNLKHPTAGMKTGIDSMLPVIAKLLREEGTQLYAATRISPLSEILPVFDEVNKNG